MRTIKHTLQDYFKPHRSQEAMKSKLAAMSLRYIVRQLEKGRDTVDVICN